MPRNQIPKLPGGAFGAVKRMNADAATRFKKGLRPVDPRTMDPNLKKFLKRAGLL